MNPNTLRLVGFFREAALRGEPAPTNAWLAGRFLMKSTASVDRVLKSAIAHGFIIVESGNASRVVMAADGSWRTAGEATGRRIVKPVPVALQKAPSRRRHNDANHAGNVVKAKGRAKQMAPLREPLQPIPAVLHPARCCNWPMWNHSQRPTHVYCAQPRESGRPYCVGHEAQAKRRDAA